MVATARTASRKKFGDVVNEYPITTGPYTIAHRGLPRRIEFVRDPNYWARDLGVSKGQYNFDRIVYRYYQDNAIAIEAFKAGEFDFLMEYSARRWARQHAGPKWDDGRIVKEEFPTGLRHGLAVVLLQPPPPAVPGSPRARGARARLRLRGDQRLQAVQAGRTACSPTPSSPRRGMPSEAELTLLEPFRAEIPPAAFGPAWQDPRTDLDPNGLRNNLKRARKLLEEAGWKVDAEGVLRNAKGEPFEFEWLEAGEAPAGASPSSSATLRCSASSSTSASSTSRSTASGSRPSTST